MSISIEIPDDIMETVKLPPDRAKRELTREMAFFLYQRRLLSMGNARKLAGLDKYSGPHLIEQKKTIPSERKVN
jgi:predicted HTH domain antitoxin